MWGRAGPRPGQRGCGREGTAQGWQPQARVLGILDDEGRDGGHWKALAS